MINLDSLEDHELLEMLSSDNITDEEENKVKEILRSRKVEFVDFNSDKSSNNFSLATVGSVLAILAFILFKIIKLIRYS